MKIYNLFPPLAGPVTRWQPHLERAGAMGFDWVFVNPIQQPGRSRSLYSIADYFRINKSLVDPGSGKRPETQAKEMVAQARRLGLGMMIDLVINHCAVDSKLVKEHPDWFLREGGRVKNPSCVGEDGQKVVWQDLAQFNHKSASCRADLIAYFADVIRYLVRLGFTGFRCDAAYQIPPAFWRELIERVRADHGDLVFVAETLGCSPEQTARTAKAGFDYIFNSAKWWDFSSPWLLEQYDLTRRSVPSVGFPESHDTERLYQESGNNVHALEQRYLFTALFSSGVMMPIGYEYGFRKRLHVTETRPEHWEEPAVDLTEFIGAVNRIKSEHPIFGEEAPIQHLDHPDEGILVLRKSSGQGNGQALLVINKDPSERRHFHCHDLYQHLESSPTLRDVSPQWPMEFLPTPFEFTLGPGMARVMVTH